MITSFRVRSAVLLALATFVTPPTLFALDTRPVPAVAPVPPVPAVPPEPPEPPVAALAALDDDGDENVVRGALREAHNELRGAHEEVARAMRDVQRHVKTFRLDAGGPNVSRTLVVPAPDATGEQVTQVREDLTIMSRLLQKAATPEGQGRNNFRFDFGDVRFGGRTDLDAMYLEGYGALFLLNVDYPLSSPPKEEPKKAEAKEKKDAAWEQARREVAGKGEPEEFEDEPDADEARGYDSDKVSGLKQRITEALRSAANVRVLKPNENVIVQVTGRATKGSKAVMSHSASGGSTTIWAGDPRKGGIGSSVLTFRASRKDVESFSEGRFNADEFARKVSVTLREEANIVSPKVKKF